MFHGLTIREYIKEHIDSDTEYWQFGGADYILSYLLKYSDRDWDWLSKDILNWQEEEVEILAISLAHKQPFLQDTDRILRQRFNLFSQIFVNIEAVQAYDLLDELLEFLCADIPELEKDALQRIQNQFDKINGLFRNENQSNWLTDIHDKISEKLKIVDNKS